MRRSTAFYPRSPPEDAADAMTNKPGDNDNAPPDPAKRLGRDEGRPLPKRFYKAVSVAPRQDVFDVQLDGRTVRTPAKKVLAVSTEPLARAIAAEWDAQGDLIDPATMPLTKLANTAIDAVAARWEEVAAGIVAFGGSDLLCYRAEAPEGLVRRQNEIWDPVLAWAKRELGAEFRLRQGVMPIDQTPATLAAVRRALDGADALTLAALHVMTTISGSAVLAIAHARGHLTLDDAWDAATVDETWQRELWGHDAEAAAAAALKRAEFAAASRCVDLLRSPR
jgi:chaperone required for assembly of F1-ATPase